MINITRRQAFGLLGATALAPALPPALGPVRPAGAASRREPTWETLVPASSFTDYAAFHKAWNYLYPWGDTHNGAAKMHGSATDHSQVSLSGGVLTLKATRLAKADGQSTSDPKAPLWYRSGAVHAKELIVIDDRFPEYEIHGEFRAQTGRGIWPAFWIAGADSVWPPESDILEYVGNGINLFNTFSDHDRDPETEETLERTQVDLTLPADPADPGRPRNPDAWHSYRVNIVKTSATDVALNYYLDDVFYGSPGHHVGRNWVGVPMNLIINLQMGSWSSFTEDEPWNSPEWPAQPGPSGDTFFRARNVSVSRGRA
ncbi:hypothetical protein ACGFNU_10405 [Spirillospora sp. NPDC048911]|uniref:glycoside hydrolase family 16 protein n=1 Tax=Spirillospora sp. NPDC048911 TaxID=3364527 RepID=UPI003718053E